ncbi:MAG: hypothetical protein HXK16_02470, partial [Alloprevotella sp.]|nr:hypothetical protein [Alloprevotella sp.]
DIQPEKSKDATTNAEVADQYTPDTRELSFAPGQQITFPFTKADKLTAVYTSMPPNWKYKVNETDKTITITAPPLSRLGYIDNNNDVVFMARDEKGNTFSRNLKLKVLQVIYVNYFYNPTLPTSTTNSSTESSTSTKPQQILNLFNLHGLPGYKHTFTRYVRRDRNHIFTIVPEKAEDIPDMGMPSENLTEFLRRKVVYRLSKDENMNNRQIILQDFIYNADSLKVIDLPSRGNQTQAYHRVLTISQHGGTGEISRSSKAIYYHPIAKETYVGETRFESNDNSDVITTRLHKVTVQTKLYIKNPHKWLEIPTNEPIDVSKIILYKVSATTMSSKLAPGGKIVGGMQSITCASNAVTYDKTKDLLYGEFANFPTKEGNDYPLMIEYTRPNGAVIRKAILTKKWGDYTPIRGIIGGVISYHIGTSDYLEKENNPHSYPVPPFSRREDDYDSWIQTISEDGSVSTSGISNTPNYEGIINGIHTFNPNPPYNDFF